MNCLGASSISYVSNARFLNPGDVFDCSHNIIVLQGCSETLVVKSEPTLRSCGDMDSKSPGIVPGPGLDFIPDGFSNAPGCVIVWLCQRCLVNRDS